METIRIWGWPASMTAACPLVGNPLNQHRITQLRFGGRPRGPLDRQGQCEVRRSGRTAPHAPFADARHGRRSEASGQPLERRASEGEGTRKDGIRRALCDEIDRQSVRHFFFYIICPFFITGYGCRWRPSVCLIILTAYPGRLVFLARRDRQDAQNSKMKEKIGTQDWAAVRLPMDRRSAILSGPVTR